VYLSDIRKVFQWYNLLLKEGLLKLEVIEEAEAASEGKIEKETKKVKTEAVKKTTKKVATKEPKVSKPAVSKKAPVVKTGSSRGK
jgi:hypothetical protein